MTSPLIPATETELQTALDNGLLAEGHHQDLKRELAPPGRDANRGLAKDLAAFSIDGGLVYIGVAEGSADRPPALHPIPLTGLKERIDQIARSVPKPPVGVRVMEISSAQAGLGYLVAVVPPSPEAPHMVDDKYWGRSDTTNYALSDAEVVRLHERRTAAAERVAFLVRDEVARDPAQRHGLVEEAHLFVIAQPVLTEPELLLRAVPEQNLRQWVGEAIVRGVPGARGDYSPNIGGMASHVSPRAHGYAAHTYSVTSDRMIQPNGTRPAEEHDLLDLEIREDGGVRLFCGRATHQRNGERLFIGALVAGHTRSVIDAAKAIVTTTGYLGSWDFGLAVSNLRGAVDQVAAFDMSTTSWPFSEDEYVSTTRATWEELDSSPDAIADRLLGRLTRALHG